MVNNGIIYTIKNKTKKGTSQLIFCSIMSKLV